MPADVLNRQRKLVAPARELAARAAALLTTVGQPSADWVITLVSDARIRELNKLYRGKDAATDVLSFAPDPALGAFAEFQGELTLGDVVVSVETASRQAAERDSELGGVGYALIDELTFLIVHGLLHLLGHDHETEAEAEQMEARERDLVAPWVRWPPRPHHEGIRL